MMIAEKMPRAPCAWSTMNDTEPPSNALSATATAMHPNDIIQIVASTEPA